MGDADRPAPPVRADPQADDAVVRLTFESAPDGIVVLDAEGRILAYNGGFLALWRFPPDMLARRDAAEMRLHTAAQMRDPQAYLDSVGAMAALARGHMHQVFDRVALRDGRVFERHVSTFGGAGETRGLVVRWRDVSARHDAEQRLAQSQARLAALFDHAINAILLADDEGRYLDANPAACDMLGYQRDELLALRVADLVVPDSLSVDAQWAAFQQHGRTRGQVQLRRKDGAVIVAQFNAVAQMLPGVNLSILSDVTDEVQARARLQALAHTDALTGIGNRRHFLERASDELARAARHGHSVALLMIDLDHFKSINDRFGHAGGDQVLQAFARMAQGVMRQGDLLARVGGEEFAALLPETDAAGACALAQRLVLGTRAVGATLEHGTVQVTASVGVAVQGPGGGSAPSVDALMRDADLALYRSKASGRDCFALLAPETGAGC